MKTSVATNSPNERTIDGTSNIKKFIVGYLMSSAAATLAETVTYPLDIVKTRLQIQGELIKNNKTIHGSQKIRAHGMFGTVMNMGVLKLWTGVTPAVYRHLVYTGCRLVFYEQFRDYFKQDNQKFTLWLAILVGCSSGAISQFISSPFDLVKVIMQAEGKRRAEGNPARISNVRQAFSQIYKEGGIKGLWRGSIVNVQRAALVSLGDLATYDFAKRYLMNHFDFEDNYKTHTLSSISSGLIAALISTPSDVIKTRIMCQPTDSFGRGIEYKSSWQCLRRTFDHEGFFGLYKGFWPTWMRMAPWSLTFWLSYEKIRYYCGLTGF